MPINRVKDRAGRARFEFEFSRRIDGQRQRVRKLLPLGWSRAQADAFDRQESARLYAEATGVQQRVYSIDQAVARYIVGRVPELKHGRNTVREIDLLADYFTGRPLSELPEVCADYTSDHRGELAPATIKNRLRYLVAACRYAWKHHKMASADPGAGVVFPAVSNERQVYISRAEMLRLARACPHWETRAMIRIAFYSGLRKGEIMAAEVEGGHFVLPDSKNGDPVRIPVHRKIRCLVHYSWPSRFITHYWFSKAREAIGRPDLHFHDIRHSTASELIGQGHDLFIVGKVLRHKSTSSSRRYAHLRDDLLEAAINSIGKRA
jgi:integrase